MFTKKDIEDMTTPFPDEVEYKSEYNRYKELYDGLKGNTDYATSQLNELIQVKKENERLHHLTNVLIEHLWKKEKGEGMPLKDIDRQMKLFDETIDYSAL